MEIEFLKVLIPKKLADEDSSVSKKPENLRISKRQIQETIEKLGNYRDSRLGIRQDKNQQDTSKTKMSETHKNGEESDSSDSENEASFSQGKAIVPMNPISKPSQTLAKMSKADRASARRLAHVLAFKASKDDDNVSLCLRQTLDLSADDMYVSFNGLGSVASAKTEALTLTHKQRALVEMSTAGDKIMAIKPKMGRKATKKAKKAEKDKTKGDAWFGMPAPEMTDEVKNDLEVLQMRGALDPRRFYKKNDMKELPKYFQVGRYVDNPVDFYTDRTTKKAKKKTFVDELMADAEFKRYNKRKFAEIIDEKAKYLPRHEKAKLLRKRKKKVDQ